MFSFQINDIVVVVVLLLEKKVYLSHLWLKLDEKRELLARLFFVFVSRRKFNFFVRGGRMCKVSSCRSKMKMFL